MKTKSLRIPKEMMAALDLVEKEEKIEEATAMRKLMKIGFETYVDNLYKQGKVTLRELVAQIDLCHPELDSGSHNLLILLDAETSSA